MKILSPILISILFLSTQSQAQTMNYENSWNYSTIGIHPSAIYGRHNGPDSTVLPTIELKVENLQGSDLLGMTSRFNINLGYTPWNFVHMRWDLTPRESERSQFRPYIAVPLVGDMMFRPGLNQLRGKQTSLSYTLGGAGVMAEGGSNTSVNFRGMAGVRYKFISESIPYGKQNEVVFVKGLAFEFNGQMAVLNRFLMGLAGEGGTFKDAEQNGQVPVRFYDAAGRLYARYRLEEGRLALDLDANYFLRMTNMTDGYESTAIQFFGLGLRVGFR